MAPWSRRSFLLGATGMVAGSALPTFTQADDRYDLLVRGGRVIDPSQGLSDERDIAVHHGRIVEVASNLPAFSARQVIDATGKLVTPGLVDLHAHVYPQGSALGLPADELVPFTATTTFVSAGDAGANNFSAFKHYVSDVKAKSFPSSQESY